MPSLSSIVADLRAAAVHDHRIDRGLFQQHDVAGEIPRDLFVAHGVAAVFHDDDLLVVALHVRQRLCENARLFVGVGGNVVFAHEVGVPDFGNLLADLGPGTKGPVRCPFMRPSWRRDYSRCTGLGNRRCERRWKCRQKRGVASVVRETFLRGRSRRFLCC
jgi:hypothetical protein